MVSLSGKLRNRKFSSNRHGHDEKNAHSNVRSTSQKTNQAQLSKGLGRWFSYWILVPQLFFGRVYHLASLAPKSTFLIWSTNPRSEKIRSTVCFNALLSDMETSACRTTLPYQTRASNAPHLVAILFVIALASELEFNWKNGSRPNSPKPVAERESIKHLIPRQVPHLSNTHIYICIICSDVHWNTSMRLQHIWWTTKNDQSGWLEHLHIATWSVILTHILDIQMFYSYQLVQAKCLSINSQYARKKTLPQKFVGQSVTCMRVQHCQMRHQGIY